MTIRQATLSDVPKLLPLMEELGYGCLENVLTLRCQKFLQNPNCGIAVYELQGDIIGCIAWSVSHLFVLDSLRFHIEALIVSNKYQRLGYGKQLLAHVEAIAKKHSPAIVDLTSGVRRAKNGTHEFYKKCGYSNDGLMAKVYLRKEIS